MWLALQLSNCLVKLSTEVNKDNDAKELLVYTCNDNDSKEVSNCMICKQGVDNHHKFNEQKPIMEDIKMPLAGGDESHTI